MSETIDPITRLKDFVANNKKVELKSETVKGEGAMLVFENTDIKLPLTAKTAWKSKHGKGYYTLGSLWLVLKLRSLSTGDYMKEAQKLNIPTVDFRDKREVINYFTDLQAETQQIDTAVRPSTLIKKHDATFKRMRD